MHSSISCVLVGRGSIAWRYNFTDKHFLQYNAIARGLSWQKRKLTMFHNSRKTHFLFAKSGTTPRKRINKDLNVQMELPLGE